MRKRNTQQKRCLACGDPIEKGEFCGNNCMERYYGEQVEETDIRAMQDEQKLLNVRDLDYFSIGTL